MGRLHTLLKMLGRWIRRGGPIKWPTTSPDLTPLDFYLWGFLKAKVYHNKPKILEELKQLIRNAVLSVSTTVLESVFSEFQSRIRLVVANDGKHSLTGMNKHSQAAEGEVKLT